MRSIFQNLRDQLRGGSPSPAETDSGKDETDAADGKLRAELIEFKLSGLVDREWYLERNSDVASAGVDPFDHFIARGGIEQRNPNPFFDTAWYLQKNPDVAQSGMNPLVHYWMYGERENRQPSLLFDPKWYREKYAGELRGKNALGHYLQNRHLRKFSPTPLFDIDFYLATNADIAAATVEPLFHYITTGYREGRNPSATFITQYYLQRFMRGYDRDPLTHYAEHGKAAGHPTMPDAHTPIPAAEIRRFTSKGPEFEELNPHIAGKLTRRAKAIAYYLPQFHPIPENDLWWGKGFTEWTNIVRGTPRFKGHYQPRIPRDFGFYDLTNPEVMPKQVAAAKAAGLFGFCFYYYNFNGKRLLEAPIESFLQRPEIDFPFCLMWANENWTRRWDGAEAELLMPQDYRPEDAIALVDDLARHFRDDRYIRVNGRPMVFLYRADVIPDTRNTIQHWRELFQQRHNERPWILMAQTFDCEDPTKFGFDGAVEFPPHKVTKGCYPFNADCQVFDDNFAARVYRYEDIVATATAEHPPSFPLIKTVFPSWDNDARRQGQGMSVANSSPQKYEEWLDAVIRFAQAHPFHDERFVFINAWNEWAEGTYLEPDVYYGGAYLNATARVLTGMRRATASRKLLLVGHNAFPAGAQMLLLNLAKTLKNQFGFTLEILLGGEGALLSSYQAIAPVTVAATNDAIYTATRRLSENGFDVAIANSAGSGVIVDYLKHAGFKVLTLVHEMPKLIRENSLQAYAERVAAHSDEVIFPSTVVRDSFEKSFQPIPRASFIRPQGIYQEVERVADARESVREELGLPADARIVVNVGYGDLRKGLDLFCAIARMVADRDPNVFFLWAGEIHLHLAPWIADQEANPNVRFLGHRSDVARLLSAADAFALTSREDPFPSVVLEAVSLGLPVVAFNEAGGFSDIVGVEGAGKLVPYGDIVSFSTAVTEILESGHRVSVADTETLRQRFSFDSYAFDLVKRADPALKRISVVVPNFNYDRYLPERLSTIFQQIHPVFEVIVLDDCSTDKSAEIFEDVIRATGRTVKFIRNDKNSGSVFAQWAKGASLARGDLIWIAEADDLSDPMFLHRLSRFFDDEEMAFAFCDSKAIDATGKDLELSYKAYYSKIRANALTADAVFSTREFATEFLSERNAVLNASSILWRKDVLLRALSEEKKSLSELKLAGDWLAYLSACSAEGKVGYCASQLNVHRRHSQAVTSATAKNRHLDEIRRVHRRFNDLFGTDDKRVERQMAYLEELKKQFELEATA